MSSQPSIPAENPRPESPSQHGLLKLVVLDRAYSEKICSLEQQCYPNPWSAELIAGEFDKAISFRPGFLQGEHLVAYSFNYLVADELHVLNLAVHPEHRSRGLGRRLLAYILSYAARNGAAYATLEVRESNAVAQSLYVSVGFKVIGLRKSYYRDNGENALILERKLSPEFTLGNLFNFKRYKHR